MISEVTVSEGDYELSSNISISNPAESQDSQTPDTADFVPDFPRCQSSQIFFCFTELWHTLQAQIQPCIQT